MPSDVVIATRDLTKRYGVVREGRLIEELSFDELRVRSRRYVAVAASNPDRAVALLNERLGIKLIERAPDGELRLFDGLDRVEEIARTLVGAGLDLTRLGVVEEDLEAHFMRITEGRE